MRSNLWACLLVGPILTLFGVFVLVPCVGVVLMSFGASNGFNTFRWVGFDNFRWILHDPDVRTSLIATLRLTTVVVVATTITSTVLAAMIHRTRRLAGFYRVIFTIPMVVTPVASAAVWRWFYRPDTGLFNLVLRPFGVERVEWLSHPNTAVAAVAAVEVWMVSSFFILVLLAGLDNIEPSLYEAAALDGAGCIAQFRHVTLPSIRPLVWFVMIQSMLIGMRMYDVATVINRRGGPRGSTRTLTMLLTDEAFISARVGRSSTVGLLLLLASTLLTVVMLAVARFTSDHSASVRPPTPRHRPRRERHLMAVQR